MRKQPKIEVGIMALKEVHFSLSNPFECNNSQIKAGDFQAVIQNNRMKVVGNNRTIFKSDSVLFSPNSPDSFFELKNVTIGVNFHWQKQENQRFRGALKLIPEGSKVRVINIIDPEEYLKSVISSEMAATSFLNFLKAHAVISRSWLLAQIEKTKSLHNSDKSYQTSRETENEIIRWYDREDHLNFDVCADDHCQRYQGITKIHSEKALEAVNETLGEVLIYKDKICDARFSKCCGGISEDFTNVWEPVSHPYLTKIVDGEKIHENYDLNLTVEKNAKKWIKTTPPAFCNTSNQKILSQVLPDFDLKTSDFYRWEKVYSQKEISELIKKRSGIDFGQIIKLEPIERGVSGRIIKLKISGTKKILTVGKELEIRKWLSSSHLYSSAFVVDHLEIQNGIPQKFILTGAGWGHGVGLCQIGAAVMGEKGYSYTEILNHYFKDAKIKKIYTHD